jgi:hypothetical protein
LPRYKHSLSIGATGMLAGAAQHLDACSSAQTLIARHASSFAAHPTLAHTTAVDADWHKPGVFLQAVQGALVTHGPADLCLLWLHRSASALLDPLFALLGGHPCRVIHVLGSSAGDPRESAERTRQQAGTCPRLVYHTVTLGSVREAGTRRWLTHAEIAGGAIACEQERRDVIVGEVVPAGS